MPDIWELSEAQYDLVAAGDRGHDGHRGHDEDEGCGCGSSPSLLTIAPGDVTIAPSASVEVLGIEAAVAATVVVS